MFDVKDTDFFDLEDESFDTIVENDISFSGSIKMKKPFMIRGKVNGKIHSESRILFVDDGSSDQTWTVIKNLSGQDSYPGCSYRRCHRLKAYFCDCLRLRNGRHKHGKSRA